MKAFVSSTFEDLKEHRAVVIQSLRRSSVQVDPMEEWTADSRAPLEFCEARLAECDLCVLLVAFRRGFVPPGKSLSITQLEYAAAKMKGMKILVFLVAEKSLWFPEWDERGHDPEVVSWRHELSQAHVCSFFGHEPSSLGGQVSEAIARSIGERRGDARDGERTTPAKIVTSNSRLDDTGKFFEGRENELRLLDSAWEDPGTRIVEIVGQGGEGKTALVLNWRTEMSTKNWLGAERVHDWSFYGQAADNQQAASSDMFFVEAFDKWFHKEEGKNLRGAAKGEYLAELVATHRTLLILDGLEPFQRSGTDAGALMDEALKGLLTSLAERNSSGLCVITTRVAVADLSRFENRTVVRHDLSQLSEAAGVRLLKALGVLGADSEFRAAVKEFNGHAFALNLLGNYLRKATPDRDIRRWREVKLLNEDKHRGNHARAMLRAYENWLRADSREIAVLRLLGLFDREADEPSLAALRSPPAIPGLTEHLVALSDDDDEWHRLLSFLEDIRLITRKDETEASSGSGQGTISSHPLLREYFAAQLEETNPDAWRTAHSRLFDCLRASTVEHPDTIPEMNPLFHAVAHGCRAGRCKDAWQEVYWPRISRKSDQFSVMELSAWTSDLAALRHFYTDAKWKCIAAELDAGDRACLRASTSYDLRAVGQIEEAIPLMRQALADHRALQNWWPASDAAGNLSELLVLHGDLEEARKAAAESITLSEQSIPVVESTGTDSEKADAKKSHAFNIESLADALHHLGRLDEAEEEFQRAEKKFMEYFGADLCLSGIRGYHFADLLLDRGRHEEVRERSVKWEKFDRDAKRPHGVGLAMLARARAIMLAASGETTPDFAPAKQMMDAACDYLRRKVGHQELITRSQIAAGELCIARGDLDEALAELTGANEDAKRGQMRLLEADARLQLARLHLHRGDHPAAEEQLIRVETMCNRMGYGRRTPEVGALRRQLKASAPTTL